MLTLILFLVVGIVIGQGLRCTNPHKEKKLEMIPGSRHTCELFEFKSKK
jgi:hypothetical protein